VSWNAEPIRGQNEDRDSFLPDLTEQQSEGRESLALIKERLGVVEGKGLARREERMDRLLA
jgi:hypothetical protein